VRTLSQLRQVDAIPSRCVDRSSSGLKFIVPWDWRANAYSDCVNRA